VQLHKPALVPFGGIRRARAYCLSQIQQLLVYFVLRIENSCEWARHAPVSLIERSDVGDSVLHAFG
jgi:hypothetical protein